MKRPPEEVKSPNGEKRVKTADNVTTDDGYELWYDLEAEEYRFAEVLGPDEPIDEGEAAKIKDGWDKLGSDKEGLKRRGTIVSTIRNWQKARAAVMTAEDLKREYKDSYPGGPDDDDDYGNLDQGRPFFETYKKSEEDLHEAIETLRDLSEKLLSLRGDRRNENVTMILEIQKGLITAWEHTALHFDALKEAADRKIAKRKRLALGQLDVGWVGAWLLGGGSCGNTNLWAKQDPMGLIIDRVVIKDCAFPENGVLSAVWDDPDTWTEGKPRSASNPNSLPTEVHALYSLRSRIGSSSILKIRNWRFGPDRAYRILTEFCPLGDLIDLLGAGYSDHLREGAETDHSLTIKLIPEPFLWCVFSHLCTAGLLMERGDLERDSVVPWDTIIHRDIKPENIFLSLPSSTSSTFKGYPVPKLGDFGFAYLVPKLTSSPDQASRDPLKFEVRGTHSYRAPEQDRSEPVKPLSSATNVWGIGAVMWTLIMAWTPPEYPILSDTNNPFDPTANSKYSKELRGLVLKCLRHEIDERPSLDFLVGKISKYTTPGVGDRALGLRDTRASDPRFTTTQMLDHGKNDGWALGMRLRDVVEGLTDGEDIDDFPLPAKKRVYGSDEEEEEDDLGGAAGTMMYSS